MKNKILVWIVLLGFLAGCNLKFPQENVSTEITPGTAMTAGPTATTQPCLASGNQDDINARLLVEGSVAVLCQGAVFELTSSVMISADHQQIYTEGFPIDEQARSITHRFN